MRYLLAFIAFIGIITNTAAQIDSTTGKRYLPNRGVIVTGSTLSPSFHLRNNIKNFYFHGYLEYFFSRRVSLRGNFFALGVSTPKPKELLHNHYIVYGGLFHFPHKNFDAYIGLEPGVALVRTIDNSTGIKSKFGAVPLITASVGCRYFVGKFFNFLAEVRYMHGKHFTQTDAFYLDALTISIGLGFNIDAAPKK